MLIPCFPESIEELNPQELPLSALKRHKRTDKVHYISLKPFSKKERKRQKLFMATNEVDKPAVTEREGAEAPEEVEEDENEVEEVGEDEEFCPRSPVALPAASTCKSILVGLGFALTERSKKGE